MNYEITMNNEPVVAEVTDHEPTEHSYEEPITAAEKGSVALYDAYGYEPCFPSTRDESVPPSDPCSALPPDRLARKQRHMSRRGGAYHGDLLRSAVIAAMESQDASDEDDGVGAGRHRRDSLVSLQESLAMSTSPRKRARIFARAQGSALSAGANAPANPDKDKDVESARNLFLSMCNVDANKEEPGASSSRREPIRRPPTRRVSRRTSYDSQISDDLDLDGFSDSD